MATSYTSEQLLLPPLRAVADAAPVRLPGIEHILSLNDFSCSSRMLPFNAPYTSVGSARRFSSSSSVTNESLSSSSSITNESRSPSPSPSDSSASSHTRPFMRLVPSDMAQAEAVVVVPPSGQKPLLLIGPALKLISHPQRRISQGARIYPYRREMRPSRSRETSLALTDCSES